MLTNQSKYAIRAVLCLAINTNSNNKMGSKDVAERIDIPAPFLAKIFQSLSKAKLIKSTKGPNGGFYLTDKERHNNLLDIVECIDGLDKFDKCFIGLPKCSDENPCAIHHIVHPFKTKLFDELTRKTIGDFAEETKKGKSFIIN
ncbi:MAG: Rrf2 family transcriptional regulator [Bacteroidota bacterium]